MVGARSAVRPSGGTLPVCCAGGSSEAIRLGSQYADVHVFPGEPAAGLGRRIAGARATAACYGQSPRFGVAVWLIAAATEDLARRRAESQLAPERAIRLVGSYEQVAQELLDYVAAGAEALVIGGCDAESDAADCVSVIRLVRERLGLSAAARRPGSW